MKEARAQKDKYWWFHLYKGHGGVRFIDTESRMVRARGWWRGVRNYCLTVEIQLKKMESSGDGWWRLYNSVDTFNITDLYTLKWLKWSILRFIYIYITTKTRILVQRLLRVPWTAKRSNQSILKEINPKYSLERLILKLKFQYFGHLMRRADSLE